MRKELYDVDINVLNYTHDRMLSHGLIILSFVKQHLESVRTQIQKKYTHKLLTCNFEYFYGRNRLHHEAVVGSQSLLTIKAKQLSNNALIWK